MSFFLFAAGVTNASESGLSTAIEEFGRQENIRFSFLSESDVVAYLATGYDSIEEDHWVSLLDEDNGNWFIVLPAESWVGELCQHLSAELQTAVIQVAVDDGNCWSYHLYSGGLLVDCFSTWPDRRARLDCAHQKHLGNPDALVQAFPYVSRRAIERYLIDVQALDEQELTSKAYDDDLATRADFRQLADFLAKLGFPTLANFWGLEGEGEV